MTDTPRPTAESPATEAGRAFAAKWIPASAKRRIEETILAIEAEAAALSDSALRDALETMLYAATDPSTFFNDPSRDAMLANARALLAQPTQEAEPSLDAE